MRALKRNIAGKQCANIYSRSSWVNGSFPSCSPAPYPANMNLSTKPSRHPSAIARAVGERRGADQFFVCPFRRASVRDPHSCCGGINDHGGISPCAEGGCATEKKGRGFGH